jgi:hypothetical protein
MAANQALKDSGAASSQYKGMQSKGANTVAMVLDWE